MSLYDQEARFRPDGGGMLSFASFASSGAIGGEDRDTVEETSSDDFRTGGTETETTEQAAERLDQDRETVEKLIAVGFKGPVYKEFEGDMWAYALPVILDFLRTGKMMELCASRNVTVNIPPQIREMLHTSPQVRDEYAVDIISRSFKYFCTILRRGRWKPGPGQASLKTFFIGNCAFAFHAVMREQHGRHQLRLADVSALVDLPLVERTPSPADRAQIMDSLRRILRKAKPEARQICGLILLDLSRAEIAAMMGMSERAVEGHMYRLRRQVHRMVGRGEIEPYGRRTPATAELVAS